MFVKRERCREAGDREPQPSLYLATERMVLRRFSVNEALFPPELGYRLKRRVWSLGLATEGSRALIDRAFGELGVEHIWAQTMAVNAASHGVTEKCGMPSVRTFHECFRDPLPGTEFGEVDYEILRADWIKA